MINSIAAVSMKAGGYQYRQDNYTKIFYSRKILRAGEFVSMGMPKDVDNEVFYAKHPNHKSSYAPRDTLNGSWDADWDGRGTSLAADNLYIILGDPLSRFTNSDIFAPVEYNVGYLIELSDVYVVSQNIFVGSGDFGTIKKGSHRIHLVKKQPRKDLWFKILTDGESHVDGHGYIKTHTIQAC